MWMCILVSLLPLSYVYPFILPDIVWSVFKDAKGAEVEQAVGDHLRHSTTRLKRKSKMMKTFDSAPDNEDD